MMTYFHFSSCFQGDLTVVVFHYHTLPILGQSWQQLLVWVPLFWDYCTKSLNKVLLIIKSCSRNIKEILEGPAVSL